MSPVAPRWMVIHSNRYFWTPGKRSGMAKINSHGNTEPRFSKIRRTDVPQLEFETLWSSVQKQPPIARVKKKNRAKTQEYEYQPLYLSGAKNSSQTLRTEPIEATMRASDLTREIFEGSRC